MARKEAKEKISVRLKPSTLEALEAIKNEQGAKTTTEIIEKLLDASIEFYKNTK